MELLQRYLHAVSFWLPKAQRDDIIAELREDLQSQIEEQESVLGRPLTDAEIQAVLKLRGSPVSVANRYLPQRYLIGPLLFPVYMFVLKVVAWCYVVPWATVFLAFLVFGRHDEGSTAGLGSVWFAPFISVVVVTGVFAMLERTVDKAWFQNQWDPNRLPRVPGNAQAPSGLRFVLEAVINLIFVNWWAATCSSPLIVNNASVKLMFYPVWRYFFWGFLFLMIGNVALAGYCLLRPDKKVFRAVARLVIDLAGGILLCVLTKANIVAILNVASAGPTRSDDLRIAINQGLMGAFPYVVLATAIVTGMNAIHLFRLARTNDLHLRKGGSNVHPQSSVVGT